ncbi:MAG TPA: hypothetical protein VF902_00350 [Coriobacteriia bacterium]
MNWALVPALLAAAVMTVFGVGALVRPSTLAWIGISADSPLGTSEIRAVFGGMFVALGLGCILLRQPAVFGLLGAAWLADLAVRLVSVFVDRIPAKDAVPVLGVALVMGAALASGYWLA